MKISLQSDLVVVKKSQKLLIVELQKIFDKGEPKDELGNRLGFLAAKRHRVKPFVITLKDLASQLYETMGYGCVSFTTNEFQSALRRWITESSQYTTIRGRNGGVIRYQDLEKILAKNRRIFPRSPIAKVVPACIWRGICSYTPLPDLFLL